VRLTELELVATFTIDIPKRFKSEYFGEKLDHLRKQAIK
jgi:hypothetical protein